MADPIYTLLFEGLWTLADREGRLEDRPVRIKGELFPYRDGLDVNALLAWLETNGFIQRYEAGGKRLIFVLEFAKHQNPHKNEPPSELPAPPVALEKKPEEIGTRTDLIGGARADCGLLTPDCGLLTPEEPPRKRSAAPSAPADVDAQVWADWLALRKAKKAPVTATVIEGAMREAIKADLSFESFLRIWCQRGSQGLQADWLKPHERPNQAGPPSKQAALEARNAATVSKILENLNAG